MQNDHDLLVIYRNPKELVPYAKNSRLHSAEQIGKIRASIREFGFTNPILLKDDEVTIGAGHARCQAATLEKLDRVPTIILRGLTEEQWRAYVIADNQLAITGSSWDDVTLKMELADLQGLGFDLGLTGFSSLDLTKIFSTQDGLTDPDEIPEPPANPVSQAGDLWQLGEHRLICGDSTDKATVERVLEGQKPHLCISDPPYGVEYSAQWRNEAMRSDGTPSDGRAIGKVSNDYRADWREAWALFPGDVIYVWHAGVHAGEVEDSLIACGFEIRSQIIWAKNNIAIGRGHYHWQHEPAFYCVRKGTNGHWSGDRKQSTLWQIDKPHKSETGHSTQKPVECMARPLRNNSSPGDRIYEPFSGSFTTGIAAQMNKRIVHAVEIDPIYVDLGILRWEAFTGLKAVLAETGETFEEVKGRRLEVV